MGKYIVIVILIGGYLLSRPALLPMTSLKIHAKESYEQGSKSVGGPCMQKKCVTIYVAPWCSTCRILNPMIIDLVDTLKTEGISAEVVVGKDKLSAVTKYADKYPFPVLLDTNNHFYRNAQLEGVPYFVVTNHDGEIQSDYYGGFKQVTQMRKVLEI